MINELFYKHLTIKNLVFLIVSFLAIIFMFQNIEITILFFASIVIACSLNPLVDKLENKMGRNVASILVLFGFIFVLILFLIPIFALGIYQITAFADAFTKYVNNIDDIVKTNQFLQMIGVNQESVTLQLNHLSEHADTIFNGTLVFVQGLGSIFVYLLIFIICTYFFIVDKVTIKKTVLRLFPSKTRKRAQEILEIIGTKIGGYVLAQAYAIASVAIVMAIILLIFRVDYPILLSLITAVLDIVPIVGPMLALTICLIATFEAGWLPVVGVLVAFFTAQLIEDNVVKPYFFSKLLNIHPILIFLFLFIGAKYFGILGALFAPAIAAVAVVLVEELYMKNIE